MTSIMSIVRRVLLTINKLFVYKDYISFCSLPDFSDNPQALFDYIYNNYDISKLKLCWHLMDKKNYPLVKKWLKDEYSSQTTKIKVVAKYSLASIFYFFRSRVIIDSHGMYEFKTNKQLDLYLFHAMPVKKVGYLLHTDLEPVKLEGFHYSVTSAFFKEVFKKAFYADDNSISISGMPRNDYLFYPIESFDGIKDYVIFMPTFRKTNGKYNFCRTDTIEARDTLFNISEYGWKKIDSTLLEKELTMYIKPHPSDELQNIHYLNGCKNIKIINDEVLLEKKIPLYRFIAGSSCLITDYSSTYIDYLLTDKPICFFIPDYEKYKENRGFVFDDFEKMLTGKVCRTEQDLEECIREGFDKLSNYQEVKEFIHDIRKPYSSKLLMDEFKDVILKKKG